MSVATASLQEKASQRGPYIPIGRDALNNPPRSLTEQEIDSIILESLKELIEKGRDDLVVRVQVEEYAAVLRKDLRRVMPCADVDLSIYVTHIRQSLLKSAILVHERTGTIAASATVVDLSQKVISEKRGGSGKESGLGIVTQFNEAVSASDNRKVRYIKTYTASPLSPDELTLLKRDLIGIRLSEVIVKTSTEKYEGGMPHWYGLIDTEPPAGYHYAIDLNLIRMANRGIIIDKVVDAIYSGMTSDAKKTVIVIASPHPYGRIDVYFLKALNSISETTVLGNKYITSVMHKLYVQGIVGVEWITEQVVSLRECVTEVRQLLPDRWVTYYSIAPALKIVMGEKHLMKWLDDAGLVDRELDERGESSFYTSYDPLPLIEAYSARPESKETMLEIEYTGEDALYFFRDKRFDTRCICNDPNVNVAAIGISGSYTAHCLELFSIAREIVSNYDSRHSNTITSLMFSTGEVTGISIKGLEKRGADAMQRLTFRQAEKVITEEAASGFTASNATVTSAHFVGTRGTKAGSHVWRSMSNPLAGVIGEQATPEFTESLRGGRLPSVVVKKTRAIEEAREEKLPSKELSKPPKPRLRPSILSGRRTMIPSASSSETAATSSTE